MAFPTRFDQKTTSPISAKLCLLRHLAPLLDTPTNKSISFFGTVRELIVANGGDMRRVEYTMNAGNGIQVHIFRFSICGHEIDGFFTVIPCDAIGQDWFSMSLRFDV